MSDDRDVSQRSLRARVREFNIPPITDGLIVGKDAPIGSGALRRAVQLLVSSPFEHVEIGDEVISDLLVRAALLRRIPRETLISFVLKKVKPFMGPEEILHLSLDAELTVEERLL